MCLPAQSTAQSTHGLHGAAAHRPVEKEPKQEPACLKRTPLAQVLPARRSSRRLLAQWEYARLIVPTTRGLHGQPAVPLARVLGQWSPGIERSQRLPREPVCPATTTCWVKLSRAMPRSRARRTASFSNGPHGSLVLEQAARQPPPHDHVCPWRCH
jgi:hypothetical protein